MTVIAGVTGTWAISGKVGTAVGGSPNIVLGVPGHLRFTGTVGGVRTALREAKDVKIPTPGVPIATIMRRGNQTLVMCDRDWYRFFQNLYDRTGGAERDAVAEAVTSGGDVDAAVTAAQAAASNAQSAANSAQSGVAVISDQVSLIDGRLRFIEENGVP